MTERNIVLDKAVRSVSRRKGTIGAGSAAGTLPSSQRETSTSASTANVVKPSETIALPDEGEHAFPPQKTLSDAGKRTAQSKKTPRHVKPAPRQTKAVSGMPPKGAAAPDTSPKGEPGPDGKPAADMPRVLKDAPTLEQLEKELKRERHRVSFGRVLRNTLFSLVVVSAVSVLVAVLLLPVLQIHGSSMTPTLNEQDIVAAVSTGDCKTGDLIAFYYNNNILIKRVIAGPGDWVDIDADGNVSVNGQPLEEPYLTEKARGDTDLSFPYQVPDARFFVMGNHRATSIDSRSSVIGCVSREMIIGRIIMRVWPLVEFRIF